MNTITVKMDGGYSHTDSTEATVRSGSAISVAQRTVGPYAFVLTGNNITYTIPVTHSNTYDCGIFLVNALYDGRPLTYQKISQDLTEYLDGIMTPVSTLPSSNSDAYFGLTYFTRHEGAYFVVQGDTDAATVAVDL